jgi:flagellar assembly factor FliW
VAVTIKTKAYGEIEVDENLIIDFPDGLLGFDFVKKFAILDSDDSSSPLKWLQAVEESELAFVIIRTDAIMDNYKLVIPSSEYVAIDSTKNDDIVVMVIVTIPANPNDMTANLQGPIIINFNKRMGKQAISLSDKYTVRERILDLMQERDQREAK